LPSTRCLAPTSPCSALICCLRLPDCRQWDDVNQILIESLKGWSP
jgi:hypothetical protein